MTESVAGALVVGASGGIGGAVLARLLDDPAYSQVVAVSRSPAPDDVAAGCRWLQCDGSEAAIETTIAAIEALEIELHRVVICAGVLHRGQVQPEKSLDQVSAAQLHEVLDTNLLAPALWVSRLARPLRKSRHCVIAALSARVGSIGDNRLGGWYSYRASKAALNMFLQTASVEYARRAKGVKLIAFHPGTTDTALSQPFQKNVPPEKLFTPAFVAERLLGLMDDARPDGSLSFLDWAGETVPW